MLEKSQLSSQRPNSQPRSLRTTVRRLKDTVGYSAPESTREMKGVSRVAGTRSDTPSAVP